MLLHHSCVYRNTGKTSRARALAHYYNTPVLVVDDVVTEALYYSGSPAAVTARLLCTEAALRAADPSSANDSNTDKTTPVQRPARVLLATVLSTALAFHSNVIRSVMHYKHRTEN